MGSSSSPRPTSSSTDTIPNSLAVISLAWELLEYLDESEGESAATEQQARELSPGVTISNDVKFGFIVTAIALVTLLTTIQVAIRLSVYL